MAYKKASADNRFKNFDPKALKHRSDYTPNTGRGFKMIGDRTYTDIGYRIGTFQGKTFESYLEVLAEGMCTDLSWHDKKTRMIRVLNGTGYLRVIENPTEDKASWKATQAKLAPGTCIEFEAGKAYQVISSRDTGLEVVVTQDAKYESRLFVLESSETKATMGAGLVEDSLPEEGDLQVLPVRGVSKAVQQSLSLASSRGRGPVSVPVVPSASASINKSPNDFMAEMLSRSGDG